MANVINPIKDGQWQCQACNSTKGVTNGVCPTCGPTQTVPKDDTAEVIAGTKSLKDAGKEDHTVLPRLQAERLK